ncbi:hypothetical protein SteCoe_36922 [Stentor coeruleus]|uniref:Uncharacterized protein n=1 Tax=Stentor coeruleus TaxID=5963 RepID=A0A1R2AP27_9CILI|nr:hypothetical protein SteCoe_36922 [Stentor coeruleus]
MGCQTSMCTDADELLLSQKFEEKCSEFLPSLSEKTTDHLNLSAGTPPKKPSTPFRSFNLLKSVVKIILKDLPNYLEILTITDVWIEEMQSFLVSNSLLNDDIKTKISLDSSGKCIWIKHEIDGSRNFGVIKTFCEKIQKQTQHSKNYEFDGSVFESNVKFLISLCPLTISLYLKIGTEIDFGIGVDKPMDVQKTANFLSDCSDIDLINKWISLNNHPIATFCFISVIRQSRYLNFCIFDGLRMQNIDKGLSLLENFGAPVSSELNELLRRNTADEVNCCLEILDNKVNSISLEAKTEDMGECMISVIDSGYNSLKWTTFNSLLHPSFISVELNPAGFCLKKIALL